MKIIVSRSLFVRFIDRLCVSFRVRLLNLINRQLAICCCLIVVCLSGCVKYDTGVNFHGLNYGEIIEQIQIGEQLNSFSHNAVQTWLNSIEHRTKQAHGHIERITDREFKVVIPFDNARDLVTKINQYFNPAIQLNDPKSQFNSHLQVEQNNFLLVIRNHLTYDIDLRSMIVQSSDPKVSVASGNFVDLDFSLHSPLGVASIDGVDKLTGIENSQDHRVIWQLKPGQINHIDAVFWLINPLGIGAILITLISIAGYYAKYRQLPGVSN
jgi:hypothetical protein